MNVDAIINDFFVQFPNNKDDHSFYCSTRLPAEEAILRCEEERFELDIVIETAKNTISYFRKCFQNSTISVYSKVCLLCTTSHSFLRSTLQRLYGERIDDIYIAILSSPTLVVPIILDRLNERVQEWKNAKKHFNKIWRETTSKFSIKGSEVFYSTPIFHTLKLTLVTL
ncbi:Paired amphipathic helix protein Sin3a [Oopsacas minuta]|uniref:Paired amphipathic helix protein Sin3a n=1 Tax=Oopsacas minuta TaxID=111878 RepID=A0AAV7K6R0_9METZ|nr:Paired amphipathic helix protein Sin3a [Oopsacas minuta]